MSSHRLVVGLVLAIASATSAATVYVDASATGQNSGENWTDAFNDLQDALAAAGAGDEIWVAAGTYKPSLRTDPLYPRSVTFTLVSGVKLYGGFVGTEATLEARGTDGLTTGSRLTRLSGDIGAVGTYTDNAYHVVTASGVDDETVLEGFVISDGYRTSSALPSGAGLTCSSGSALRVNWCLFEYNRVIYNAGGALFVFDSPVVVSDCVFTHNYGYFGGAVGLRSEFPSSQATQFNRCTFGANQANGGEGYGYGGAVYLQNMGAEFLDCTFSQNVANSYGGAIYAYDGALTCEDCEFLGNTAVKSGGGVNTHSRIADRFTRTLFSNNSSAEGFGGGLYAKGAACEVVSCHFLGNAASPNYIFGGGGLYIGATSGKIYNSLIARNTGYSSGGIHCGVGNGILEVVNCTIADNQSEISAALYGSSGTIVVANVVSWGNRGASDATVFDSNRLTYNSTYSNIEGGLTGTGSINSDPLFLDPLNLDSGNYRLGVNSPSWDAGDNNAVPVGLTTDLDGDGRIVNAAVDMGAYEASPPVVVAAESLRDHTGIGELGIALSLSVSTSESRRSGPEKIRFSFSEDVVAGANPFVTLSSGSVSALAVSGNEVVATVGSFSNQTCLEVTIAGYQDAQGYLMAPNTIKLRLLEGDGNNDGVVASSDITQAKLHVGETVTESNCRWDINSDGAIDQTAIGTDVELVKAKSGTSVSCP